MLTVENHCNRPVALIIPSFCAKSQNLFTLPSYLSFYAYGYCHSARSAAQPREVAESFYVTQLPVILREARRSHAKSQYCDAKWLRHLARSMTGASDLLLRRFAQKMSDVCVPVFLWEAQ